jgi:hypothetical protein
MNIRRIYNLDDVTDTTYPLSDWCHHDAFWHFVGHELDDENFNYVDAGHEARIRVHLKAYAHLDSDHVHMVLPLEYIAISFDREYIGLVIGVDRPFGWDAAEVYITNYPKYQVMVAYAKAMFQNKPTNIVGETVLIDNLDGRFGFVMDKRFSNNMRKEDD